MRFFIDRLTTSHRLMATLRASRLYSPLRRLYHSWYAHSRLKFYSSFVNPNDLVFDIGANIGTRLGTFLELGARVVAVEPQTSCLSALNRKYGSNPRVTLVHVGIDDEEGTRTIHLCENDALSSMSDKWIDSVRASGRFGTLQWSRKEAVTVTTLDKMIERFGVPAYCKIDVEGYELHVIQGLSTGIPCLSFEFNPELRGEAEEALSHLSGIGNYLYNYCIGEPSRLELAQWIGADQMISVLNGIGSGHLDIFAKNREPK